MGDCEQMLQSPFPAACDDVGFSQSQPQTMARTFRNVPTCSERRRRRIEGAAHRDRLARRDAYREARREAAPAPLWVVVGNWGADGFGVWPLPPGRCAGPGEALIEDPGDAAHLNSAITYWQV